MMTLAAEQPRISPKAAALLVEHLDDPPSPPANTPNIIYTLLVDFPSDSSLVHTLLKFAEKSPDPNVSAYALEGLKFINTLDSEALHFASASIRSPDPQIQAADIDLIEAKHLTVRAEFSQYLHRIATSPEEPQDLRLRAQHALAQ
jgi:hypothetical protein